MKTTFGEKNNNMNISKNVNEISWSGLTYLFLKGEIISHKKMIFFAILASLAYSTFSFFPQEKNAFVLLQNHIETTNKNEKMMNAKKEASVSLDVVINMKNAVDKKINKDGTEWLKNHPDTIDSESIFNKDYITFKHTPIFSDVVYNHNRKDFSDNNFIGFFDEKKNKVFLSEEKNGFSIQISKKSSAVCEYLVKPMNDLQKIEVNMETVDFNSEKDIHEKCSYVPMNNIKYIFNITK